MNIKEFNERNYRVSASIYGSHPNHLKCTNTLCYGSSLTIRHKQLCKDGKFRVISNSIEYCAIDLLRSWNGGMDGVPFSSSEMRDLHELFITLKNTKQIRNNRVDSRFRRL